MSWFSLYVWQILFQVSVLTNYKVNTAWSFGRWNAMLTLIKTSSAHQNERMKAETFSIFFILKWRQMKCTQNLENLENQSFFRSTNYILFLLFQIFLLKLFQIAKINSRENLFPSDMCFVMKGMYKDMRKAGCPWNLEKGLFRKFPGKPGK